jgi:phosphoglycerol transferase MdoB-like AlkP superfamily enzyme
MKKKKEYKVYHYLLLKMLLAAGTLAVMQAAFYLCNTRIFHIADFAEWLGILWGNIVFGAATVAAFLSPYLLMMLLPLEVRWKRWYRTVAEMLYIIPVALMVIPRGANMAYYQYTYRLLSDEIFSYLGISGQMGSLAPHFAVDYWYAWVVPLCVFIVFLILNSRLHFRTRSKYINHLPNDLLASAIGLAIGILMLRGGIGHFIQPSDAARYCQPKNTALVSNDAYNILRTCFTPDLKQAEYLTAEEAALLCPMIHTPLNIQTESDSATTRRNIVLIVLESFGQEFMGCYNTQTDAETRTPFLDSLAKHSILYDGRSNGKKSIEGITAINTSIPNLMSIPLANSAYRNDDFSGLPETLRKNGYHTAFYHGSYNGVMDFDKTCQKIGFDEYLGMNEYNASPMAKETDYDGVWGIFDEPFLQYMVQHINTYSEPFLAEVFTVTSHHPFPIPDEHKGQFKEGRHPILKCVEYTDYSLRRFFEAAKQQPWYENTLFVIVGDHSGHGLTREYNDYDGWYRIPMIFFDPQQPEGRREARIMQQIDLYPTLVDWLGLQESFVCFGQSALQQPESGRQVYYGNGFHCLVSNDTQKPTDHSIAVIEGSYEEGDSLDLRYLKAFVQRYNEMLINNKLKL